MLDDRSSVLVRCLAGMPNAAWRTATQRLHNQPQLVSGLKCLVRPAVPIQTVGAVAFEIPDNGKRVVADDFQHNECVRAGKLEIPNNADELNRMFPIEHGNGVMPKRCTAGRY